MLHQSISGFSEFGVTMAISSWPAGLNSFCQLNHAVIDHDERKRSFRNIQCYICDARKFVI